MRRRIGALAALRAACAALGLGAACAALGAGTAGAALGAGTARAALRVGAAWAVLGAGAAGAALRAGAVGAALWAGAAGAADRAGAFDYYILALSWNAAWCAATGDARGADQCDPRHDFAFTLHGLWPQRERGWPRDCPTDQPGPDWGEAEAMADIMGSGGLAIHQWRKHGRCSGLGGGRYLALARDAYATIRQPPVLRDVTEPLRVDPAVVEAAFLEVNPSLTRSAIVVTCEGGLIREVRVCLTPALTPRPCGADAVRECRGNAVLQPIR